MKAGSNDQIESMDKLFEDLFDGVPSRPEPPADSEAWVYAQFRSDRDQHEAQKARRKRKTIWAMAASLFAIALMLLLVTQSEGAPAESGIIGTVQKHTSQVASNGLARQFPICGNSIRTNS